MAFKLLADGANVAILDDFSTDWRELVSLLKDRGPASWKGAHIA